MKSKRRKSVNTSLMDLFIRKYIDRQSLSFFFFFGFIHHPHCQLNKPTTVKEYFLTLLLLVVPFLSIVGTFVKIKVTEEEMKNGKADNCI